MRSVNFLSGAMVMTLCLLVLCLVACMRAPGLEAPPVTPSTPITSAPSTALSSATPRSSSSPLASISSSKLSYSIVDTGQTKSYDNSKVTTAPKPGEAFCGQDAQYQGNQPSYTLSVDGLTVYDNVTGLTWQRSPDTNGDGSVTTSDKLTHAQSLDRPAALNAIKNGGFSDWRLPTIKELYSLINFNGTDPSNLMSSDTSGLTPFIDTKYFIFAYGQGNSAERIIDSQYASSTKYVSKGPGGELLFGVNFADGRIKGYGLTMPGPGGPSGMGNFPGPGGSPPASGPGRPNEPPPGGLPASGSGGGQIGGGRNDSGEKTFFVQCVRGNTDYGKNSFISNGDNTITDQATGLTWAQSDSGSGMNWKDALAWVQIKNTSNYLGHSDWRLPNAKELQSIVDYTRAPDTAKSAAIDPLFSCTQIKNEAGQADYPYYWTGTTHAGSKDTGGAGIYVAFGRAMGYMNNQWQDVHGAGAQRSDPKSGDPSAFPTGRGPQGDAIHINNFVRLVRDSR